MGSPNSLLGNARAFARDFPRDQMPQGYLWDVVDYVPTIIDANLTGRGGWLWGSSAMSGDPESGIYAPFTNGDKLLIQTTNGRLFDVDYLNTPFPVTDRGALPRARQNPIQFGDAVVHFDTTRSMPPRLITNPGGVPTIGGMNAAHKNAPVGCVWKNFLLYGGAPGEESIVRFAVPGTDLTTAGSFDANSFEQMAHTVSGMASLRAVVVVFHPGSVSRIRGSLPPHGTTDGDTTPEPLFDRVGCNDPQTITYWNDNIVFADEHGVHLTDGAVIRNIASQGGILYYWRMLYQNKVSMAATTFLDYYIITVRRSDIGPTTLICDLNKRQWFRFSNINALCYVVSQGALVMERIWVGLAGLARLGRVGPCFFPDFTLGPIKDDDGTPVLPVFETPWYRLGQEGRKRIRFGYLSYDVRTTTVGATRRYPPSEEVELEQAAPPPASPGLLAALQPMMEMSYIRSPQNTSYTVLGVLPETTEYTRYRLPLGQFPYGVAFRVRQTQISTATRVFDLATEAQAAERSRV